MTPHKTVSRREQGLTGTYSVPGDKSITHRALFLGALYGGRIVIRNPSPAFDCRNTLELLRALGYRVAEYSGLWELDGSDPIPHSPHLTLDCGNSGTTARLAAGFLTGEHGEFLLVGDESLSRRPMERVAEPLRRVGGRVTTTNGVFPVAVIAEERISGWKSQLQREEEREEANSGRDVKRKEETLEEAIPVESAQVHAALVLAAARSQNGVLLRRTKPMRDHTLRMASLFGIEIEQRGEGEFVHPMQTSRKESLSVVGIDVPGDPSSAAFVAAAALFVPGSDLTIENVGLNPTRISFLETLRRMGGRIEWSIHSGVDARSELSEPSGTIRVRYSPELHGIVVGETEEPSVAMMMDELPLLALAGALAKGETVVRGAGELRLKESDRIAATVALLASIGIAVEELSDGFRVQGSQKVKGGCSIDHHGDHRLAILAGVAGLIAENPVVIPHPEVAAVSWPGVWESGIFG